MNVCIDIQAAIAQRAGVGRYAKALAEHLGAQAGDDRLRLFCFDFKRRGAPFPVSQAEWKSIRWCPGRIVQGAWKYLGWPPFDALAGPADVYHFPNFIRPPLRRGKSVVTIHDMSFFRVPETTEARNLSYMTRRIRDTVQRADALITNSEFSARETYELLGVPPDKLFPIHLGLTVREPAPESEIRLACQMLKIERPYLLTVGTIEPRKNIPFLVEVFERLKFFDGDLVIAGMRGWKYEPILERIRSSPRACRIRHLDFVDESMLSDLYSGAELFLFPSLYEGFGFPPLEAMACNVPVVASAVGALPEVLGDAALLVEGFDAEDWAAQTDRLLGDGERCLDLRARGRARAAGFTWEETARQTWAVYRKLAQA